MHYEMKMPYTKHYKIDITLTFSAPVRNSLKFFNQWFYLHTYQSKMTSKSISESSRELEDFFTVSLKAGIQQNVDETLSKIIIFSQNFTEIFYTLVSLKSYH